MALSEEQIKKTLKAKGGFITEVAKALGVTYQAIYLRIQKSEDLKNFHDEIQESYLDLAESKLITKVNEADLGAICFFLKCKGKARGYVETSRHELTGADGGPVKGKLEIEFVNAGKDPTGENS